MKLWKKVICFMLAAMLVVFMAACAQDGASDDAAADDGGQAAAAYEADAEGSILLKASGMCTYSFEEEQDEGWADNVTAVYVREMPADPAATPVADGDLVDAAKYTVSTTKVILDSDLFAVDPGNEKQYEVTIQSADADDYHLALTIQNKRPTEFEVRTIDGSGSVVSSKTFTYAEMEAMCTNEDYYTAACVMHGMNSYHAKGVYLNDLLAAAGVEFGPGMSLGMRSTDAPESIEATMINKGDKTGTVVENPESYWMKARYTDNYKLTYEDLYERDRYFVYAPWDDEAVGQMLADDGAAWSLDAREALAATNLYEKKEQPMVAIQYESFEYNTDPRDPRSTTDVVWKLSPNERAFCFLFGLAMDDDTATNYTAYDDDKEEYPLVVDESKAGLTAFEEGPDPCGTAARMTKLLCGIDIFLEGGVN
ncbi:MAG: hypothetical protein K6B40_07570 [Firmicutes bacterium]|nr:hypothetical protein [Bacillota bacterium]